MEGSMLDKNTISIIRSPNKQFYCMAAVDCSDFELFFGVQNDLKMREDAIIDGLDFVSTHEASNEFYANFCDGGLNEESSNNRILNFEAEKSASFSENSSDDSGESPYITHGDEIREHLSTSSEAVCDADLTVGQVIHTSSDEQCSGNDIKRAVSLVELICQSYKQKGHHRSEGYLTSHLEMARQPPRKCFRKSKSVQNHWNSERKDFRCKLYTETPDMMQNSSKKRNSEKCGIACCGSSTVSHSSPCGSQSISNTLGRRSTNKQHSDMTGDSESYGSDSVITSECVASTGQESVAIDQAWDGYQAPLYVAISDDSSEEKLDASCLQGDWQPMTDEFTDLSDFGNGNSIPYHQQLLPPVEDSDTDTEELRHLMKESSDALRLTRLSLVDLKSSDQKLQSSPINEPLATCETNIQCLRDLLLVVCQRPWTAGDKKQLSGLLKKWEEVESEFLQLTCCQDLSNSKSASDFIIDLSHDEITICENTSTCSSQEADTNESESTTSPNIYAKNCSGIGNRFNIFGCGLYRLFTKSSSVVQSATVTYLHTLLLLFLFLLFMYLVIHRKCWIDMMEIRIQPQLRYVSGQPPY